VATAGDGEVGIDWDDNGESDLDHYNVYRQTKIGEAFYTNWAALGISVTSTYLDNSVVNSTTYRYKVTAVNETGSESTDSDPSEEVTPEITPIPSTPTGLWGQAGNGEIELDWNDNPESNIDHYNIYRKTLT